MIADLFANQPRLGPSCERIGDGAVILHDFASDRSADLVTLIRAIAAEAPFRQMTTPGGYQMSVAMTNCGRFGWQTDRSGYRYVETDPASGKSWPAMPTHFATLATAAAETAGFFDFQPNSCLINRYEPGTKLSLHQDRDEQDLSAPIVSVSLGIPATFQFGGLKRSDPLRRYRLENGDVVVWGGPTRLAFHGIGVLKPDRHVLTGSLRYNLTFRKAG